jgi:hypothetical protein
MTGDFSLINPYKTETMGGDVATSGYCNKFYLECLQTAKCTYCIPPLKCGSVTVTHW